MFFSDIFHTQKGNRFYKIIPDSMQVILCTHIRLLLRKFAHKAKSQEVRSPTCEVLGAAAKQLGTQSIF